MQVLDEAGKPIPRFTLAECELIHGDSLESVVRWKESPRLPRGTVRLEFSMKNARLYAIEVR